MTEKHCILSPVRCVFILLTVAVMVIIFMFSCEDSEESAERSGIVTAIVTNLIVPDFDELPAERQEEILDKAEFIVRKLAHFTVYAALGFCASCAAGKRRLLSRLSGAVLLFCFLYAGSDELHQRFVSGRSGQLRDVIIDTGGSLTGILLSIIAIEFAAKMVSRHRSVNS